MAHTVIWKYTDSEGEVKVLVGHPGAFAQDAAGAVQEGRDVAESLPGVALEPLAVVETDRDVDDDIYDCPELYLGPEDNDQLFYVVDSMGKWASQPWWPL